MSNKIKEITVILPDLRAGGAEKVHLDLINVWIDNGIKVNLILLNKQGFLLDKLSNKVNLINLKVNKIRNSLFLITKILKKNNSDIILAAMWPLTSVVILSALFSNKLSKVFIVDHTTYSEYYYKGINLNFFCISLVMKFTYPFAKGIISVSNGVRDDVSKITNISKEKIKVIYNPIKVYRDKQERKLDRFNDFKHKILGVGSLIAAKDFTTLIMAFSLLPKEINAELVILGEGEEKSKLLNLIKKLSLADNIRLVGYSDNVSSWFKQADLFVNSSKYDGLPLVLLESLYHGVPIVSTDCNSGPREILDKGNYGNLVPVGDYKKLSSAILDNLLNNKFSKDKLIERSQFFNYKKISLEYLNFFEKKNDKK